MSRRVAREIHRGMKNEKKNKEVNWCAWKTAKMKTGANC